MPVEELRAGDLVLTRDAGAQPLVWAGGRRIPAAVLAERPELRPVRIAAGALGAATPLRDLVVSPQHRVLVGGRIAARMFGCDEVLVAAKHLVGAPGIEVLPDERDADYVHLLCDRHEVLRSEGAWTESLLLGSEAMKMLGDAAVAEIAALRPGQVGPEAPAPVPARRLLRGREARALLARHLRHGRALAPAESWSHAAE